MVADLREWGLSFTGTTYLVNIDWIKNGVQKYLDQLFVPAMIYDIVRKVSSIERRPQGNRDVDSNPRDETGKYKVDGEYY